MSVTQSYKTVTFSLAECYLIAQVLAARFQTLQDTECNNAELAAQMDDERIGICQIVGRLAVS